MTDSTPSPVREIIGLVPAAGHATRISPLPMSKELFPIDFQPWGATGEIRPKVVCHSVLEQMRHAGITKAFIILRSGKWDIPSYFGDGNSVGMNLGYLMMRLPYGVPYTLDQAYPFVQHAIVAMGFPDVLLQPEDVFKRLLNRQLMSGAEVVLGAFPAQQPQKVGMVDIDEQGRVRWIVEKPAHTHLRYMWCVAVWTPTFTQFLHEFLVQREQQGLPETLPTLRSELPIGDVIQAAIAHGLPVEAERFDEGEYLDIGTPDDLMRAVQKYTKQS